MLKHLVNLCDMMKDLLHLVNLLDELDAKLKKQKLKPNLLSYFLIRYLITVVYYQL